jgi:hypothetical protein
MEPDYSTTEGHSIRKNKIALGCPTNDVLSFSRHFLSLQFGCLRREGSFSTAQSRQQELVNEYPKLKLAMSMTEVEKYLGKPDFALGKPIARLKTAPEPTDKRCNIEAAYVLKKNSENMTDMEDIAIFLFYSRDGKLYWASPQNVPRLKQMGSPTGGE